MANSNQERFWRNLQDALNEQFEITTDEAEDTVGGKILHRVTGVEFKYISGGEFQMGLSQIEEQAARELCDPPPMNIEELRPAHTVTVNPFMISCVPVLNNLASRFLDLEDELGDSYPAYLTRSQALILLSNLGFRLPYEKEWEYACRANTKTLFVFGNELPEDEQLDKWLSSDFSDLTNLQPNPFGLYGLFTGEWCHDKYRLDYTPNSPVEEESFVIRGGGALFWPWQDEEWVWCVSANRMPSKDLIGGRCGLRLVFDIPEFE